MKVREIGAWEAFRGVALHGNFSKAANALGVGVPQLSKRVTRLEEQLGARLFTRSTRSVALTQEGKELLPKVSAVLDEMAGLESSFEEKKALSGNIRITAVPFIAHRLLIPVLQKFRKEHPGVTFDVELSERFTNLIESNIDIALRIHDDPKDTSLVYRKLAPNRLVLCAAPSYLKKCTAPKKPKDLTDHELLVLDIHRRLRFDGSPLTLGQVAKRSAVRCDNGWYLTELALQGFGILARAKADVGEHLKKGRLVEVLSSHRLEPFGNLYLVTPTRKLVPARVRALMEALESSLDQE